MTAQNVAESFRIERPWPGCYRIKQIDRRNRRLKLFPYFWNKMKSIQVNLIEAGEKVTLQGASLMLENLAGLNRLEHANWKAYPYKPGVEFRIGHTDDMILLKFYVEEKAVRAEETQINGEVYKDSCVEFFLCVDGRNYYNFEFSCIGTPHVGWGEGRQGRQHLPGEVVRRIQVKSSLGTAPFGVKEGDFRWSLVALIPATCLIHDPGLTFSGLSATANFYKCGDALPEPHFVTWNHVGTPEPDFHRPEYFGMVDFE